MACQEILQRHELARRGETVTNFETAILKADSSLVGMTMTIIPVPCDPDTIAIACISPVTGAANADAKPSTAEVVDIGSHARRKPSSAPVTPR
jgi:hypothetical protein